jgi:hypothetical protein
VLPDPDLRVGGHELWLWETVREWGKQRSRFSRRGVTAVSTPDIVDAVGIADRLGIETRTLDNWLRTGAFPRPDYRWDTTDAWLWETVDEWSETRLAQVPRVAPSGEASGPSLNRGVSSAPPVETKPTPPPPSTEVTIAPPRPRDPVGDLDRIQRYFSEVARSLTVPSAD